MITEFFVKYVCQPTKKFYNYITGKTEESDNVQSTADDIVQESSESLDTHIQSNENDII
ncbi:hypothetical protein HC358_01805 [Wolbachia pipientis]|uniref:Uncharacterized protein n=1 Tax=Wolbachia pipientis TaxID=955 RepID=A0A7G5C9G3_WOLPI|nr:hypothetical protein [Wolbachia pipientis]QMV45847.1 hypothetical protein HC358_01805 [Wolbachia pipientis]